MDKFTLLGEKNKFINKKNDNQIKYHDYEVETINDSVIVSIPLRECERFENELSNTNLLTEYDLKKVLRKYRGLKK